MNKIKFLIDQTGPVELTTNLGDDPAFKVSVTFSSDNTDFNKVMENVNEIYYHASEGWKPILYNHGEGLCETTVYRIIGDTFDEVDTELDTRLSVAIDQFGNRALGNLFRQAEVMWDMLKDNDSFKPASIDSDITDQMLGH